MQFSERISRISVSPTSAVLLKADKLRSAGVNLVDFGAGEPDFATPDHVKQAATRALAENFTKYTPTGGILELRRAVVERHAQTFGSDYSPEECLVTVGAKQAIFEAILATIDPGNEVILPVPYWVSYVDIICYAGGKPVLLETSETDSFQVRAEAVEKLVTPRTRMIILNSPNNPSGAVIPPAQLEELLHFAKSRNLILLSDECYSEFLYEGRPYSLGSSRDREHLLVVDSVSKTYAMTGWRIGYALGSPKLLGNMLKLQSHSTSNPTSIAQKAAVAAMRGPQDCVGAMRSEYRRRRDRIVEGLRAIPGVQCTLPGGAFYAYPNISAQLRRDGLGDTLVLADKLLEEARVAVVPGQAFGTPEHIRISYATSLENIEEGLRRIAAYFAKLQH